MANQYKRFLDLSPPKLTAVAEVLSTSADRSKVRTISGGTFTASGTAVVGEWVLVVDGVIQAQAIAPSAYYDYDV